MFAQQQMTEIGLSRCEVRLDGKRLMEALLRLGRLVLLRLGDAKQRPAIRAARVSLQKALQSMAGFRSPTILQQAACLLQSIRGLGSQSDCKRKHPDRGTAKDAAPNSACLHNLNDL
jgi:hypothetical protein